MTPREHFSVLPGLSDYLERRGHGANMLDCTKTQAEVSGEFFLLKHTYAHVDGRKTYAVWGTWKSDKIGLYSHTYDFMSV